MPGEYKKDELLEAARSGNEEQMMALLTPLNVNCHASDGRKVGTLVATSFARGQFWCLYILNNDTDVAVCFVVSLGYPPPPPPPHFSAPFCWLCPFPYPPFPPLSVGYTLSLIPFLHPFLLVIPFPPIPFLHPFLLVNAEEIIQNE